MTSTTPNIDWSVTNKSGKDIVVVSAFTKQATNSNQTGYEQSLTLLKTTDGSQTIPNGQTATVKLDQTVGGDAVVNYEILFSEPETLFPVQNTVTHPSFDPCSGELVYKPATVTSAAADNMTTALTFVQDLQAFPNSLLAKNYNAAIDSAKGKSVEETGKIMNGYFSKEKGFEKLDFVSVITLNSYLSSFARVWGLGSDGSPGRTYWVYDASKSEGSADDLTMGTIVFTAKSPAPSPADPRDRDSNYTVAYKPKSGDPVDLTILFDVFVDSSAPQISPINLIPSYSLKSIYSGNTSDNTPWPVMSGTIAGTNVVVVSQKPGTGFTKTNSDSGGPTFSEIVNGFFKYLGWGLSLYFLYDILTKSKGSQRRQVNEAEGENRGSPPSEQQNREINNNVGQGVQNDIQNRGEQLRNAGNDDGVPQNENELNNAQNQFDEVQGQSFDDVIANNYGEAITQYQNKIDALTQISDTPGLNEAQKALDQAKVDLFNSKNSGDFSKLKMQLETAKNTVNTAEEGIKEGFPNEYSHIEDDINDIDDAIETAEKSAKDAEEAKDSADDPDGGGVEGDAA